MAWVARVTIDALLLFIASHRLLRSGAGLPRKVALTTGLMLATLALAFPPQGMAIKALFASLALTTFALASWFVILAPDERELLDHRVRAVFARDTSL